MASISPRVLFVSISDEANGAENVLLMLAAVTLAPIIFLKKVKHGGLTIPGNQPIKFITQRGLWAGFLQLPKLLWKYRKNYTIVSTHPYLNAYLGFLKRTGYLNSVLIARECTSVFTRYSGFKKWTYKAAYRLGYPGVSLVVCQTELMRDQFLHHINYIRLQKVIVQPNPVNLSQLLQRSVVRLGNSEVNSPFICAAGRLIPEKGFSVLIRAFIKVQKCHPYLKLFILGEGPERPVLSQLIENCGLLDKVILKGRTDNPMPYFKHARACVVSSIKEGFPNVLLEMIALNNTVVATLCAGGIESIPDIFTVPINNADSLGTAILKAMTTDASKIELTKSYLQNRSPGAYIEAVLKAV